MSHVDPRFRRPASHYVSRYVPVLLALSLSGCPKSEESSDQGESSSAEGQLACDKTPVECRTAFADNYEGTYAGDATGRLILDIDVLGGVVGTATLVDGSSVALFGKVNEFGKLEVEGDDGSVFTGQFTKDKQLVGSWTRDDGTKGSFEAVSTTAPPPAATGDTSGEEGGAEMSGGGSTEDLTETAKEACRQLQGCEGVDEIDCDAAEGPPPGCESVASTFYECEINAGCAFMTECEEAVVEYFNCLVGGPVPEEPTEPAATDPGTGFEPTGNPTYDEATVTCSACAAEAGACHDDPVCWDYAECSSACTEVPCLQRCLSLYEAGYELWLASVDCRDINCPVE